VEPEQVRPCGDVAVHILADSSAVVFNEATQQLFSFDPLATYLWCRWEAGVGRDDLVRALDTKADLGAPSAEEMVDRCLSLWQRHHLIGDQTVRPAPEPGDYEAAGPDGEDHHGDEPGGITTSLQVGGEAYELCYASAELAMTVRPLLAHMEPPRRGGPATRFVLSRGPDSFVLRQGGEIIEECEAVDEILPMVKFCLNVDLLEQGQYAMAFHAAAVVHDACALLMPAASGRGKSVLTAALLHDGWGYLTDDSALLDTQNGRLDNHKPSVRGVGFDPCLKEKAWAILQPLFPTIDALPIHRRGDGHRVRYLPPTRRLVDDGRAYPIEWIVFPGFQQGGDCLLEPVATAEAMQRLLQEAFAPSQRLSRASFRTLAKLVENKPAHTLTYGSHKDAVAMLRQLRG